MSELNQAEVAEAGMHCSRHPERSAAAICYDCEMPICSECIVRDGDGLALCPACAGVLPREEPKKPAPAPAKVAQAYQAQLHPQPEPLQVETLAIPWESTSMRGEVSAFLGTVYLALTHPIRFMTSASLGRGDTITPTLFGLCAALLGQVAVTGQLFLNPEPIPTPAIVAAQLGGIPLKALMLALLPTLPLLIAGALLTKTVLAHAILGFFGRRGGSFESTLRIFVYAEAASLLLLFPGLGLYAEKFMAVFLVMTGLRVAHGATLGASLAALFPLLFFQMLQL